MNYGYWTFILVVLVIWPVVCLAVGYRHGKEDRKIDLSGLGAQEAFAFFLTRERHRHREDIAKINGDLKNLNKAGIKAPDIPLGLWIEVKK